MRSIIQNRLVLLLLGAVALAACKSDEEQTPGPTVNGKYVLMTATELFGAGFFTPFTDMPSGTISNLTSKSLGINNAFGFRVYKKWFFNQSNAAGEAGIQKYSVADDGSIKDEGFIASGIQAVVADETTGFYWDSNRGNLKIQKFNPTTMQRTGEIDLSSLQKPGVEFQSAGQHILAPRDGKLFASITYGTQAGGGYGDDLYDFIEFAVIDIAAGTLEKTIRYEGLRGIGWGSSGNRMWNLGDDGALYFCSTGLGMGFANSAVIRIKKGETDFDKSWIVRASDYQEKASISTVFVKGGKVFIELPSEPLKADNSNLQSMIWDYYIIDPATKQKTKIEGMPKHFYVWANDQAITEIDGKIYFSVRNPEQHIDGYYVLDGTKATQVFNLTEGFSWGFAKLDD